ncbi:MFS transporter [Halomonas aquamarina]|uniref:MFS transporter n=1 Tax=Vreelandella aquamarina TaxID=77097 RepID=A0ACC5VU47_9GAMM|nr:MFS transporter [Halomonas aquamarina]MBZ5487296.1 MFS transporter [Halomonas aquamarina]
MAFSSRLSIYLIALGAFSLGMASYVTAGLIPMVTSAFSVSEAVAAQLVTAFTLAYGLGSPLVVALLPGHRQRTGLLAALTVFVIANALSALADSFAALAAWRAVAGVGAGVYLALGIAAATALAPNGQGGKAIAILMGGMASGTVLGVPLSLLLAEQLGWASALWLIAVLGMVALGGLVCRLPPLPAAPSLPLRHKATMLKHPATVAILSVSLSGAIASLGMYTFIAPFMASPAFEGAPPVALYLWVWGLGGIAGSFLIGPMVDRCSAPRVVIVIMALLAISLGGLPLAASLHPWLALVPIALWGAAGWALQVPQNSELMRVRKPHGDGNLAVALNESALYLGSALGAVAGGVIISGTYPLWLLAVSAAGVAVLGALVQLISLRVPARQSP